MSELTHLDAAGRAQMVDVAAKEITQRRALARATVRMSPATLATLRAGNTPKGDVIAAARLAGIAAAKRTSDLIPLCHAIPLTFVGVEVELGEHSVTIEAEARATARTGVEMEALCAASVAALTLYDMVKGLEREVWIEGIALLEKSGGRSGDWRAAPTAGPGVARPSARPC